MTPRSLLSFSTRLAAAALSLFALTPAADAQCFGPDNLGGLPCCTSTFASLPSFPATSIQAQGICWDACALSGQTCMKLSLGAPALSFCSKYMAPIETFDCAGIPLLKGLMTLDYTRTWEETPVIGAAPTQVWRFAAKVDMAASSAAPPMCPVPNCSQLPGSTAFYYGYVDYTLNCATGIFETAVVLYHGCDRFIHDATFSSIPGAFHPTRTFAIVGPDTVANPFVPSIMLPPTGTLVDEAMRRVTPDPIGSCFAEEHIQQGIFQPLITGCLCPLAFQPPQQAGNHIDASGVCGGAFKSLNLWPIVPWFELTTTSIGRWSNGSSYPGPEHASVAEGLLLYTDVCDPTGATVQSFDIFYGALTQGGYTIPPTPIAVLTDRFLDLASNYSLPTSLPVVLPLFGKVAPTDHLIYVNM